MNNYNHCLTTMTPTEFAEHLKDIFPEFGNLDVEEVLVMQESAFLYIENNKQKELIASNSGETSNSSLGFISDSESSRGTSVEHQLALDEAFARALELGDDFNSLCIQEHDVSMVDITDSTSREMPSRSESRNTRQDEIDPDGMTHEELLSLGESVGTENKGLPADLISRLPTFKYKAGFLSKKKKSENEVCVICYAEYKNGATVTALPCIHRFHSRCINRWLQLNKQCPVCGKEVRDDESVRSSSRKTI